MKLFAAVLCLAFFATNEAFFKDTLTDLGNLVKDKLVPTLINTGLTTLVTGALGKRDLETESLAMLEDAVTDKNERAQQIKEFIAKLAEARKSGNVKEFLEKYREEQKQKWLARLTPEQKKKYEEHLERVKQMQAKMQAYQKKVEACRAEVKKAQEAAAKTDDKTDGSRRDLFKVYTDCLKKASQKPEETKTETQSDDVKVKGLKQLTKQEREQFKQQLEEAKKNGNVKEFLENFRAELKKKMAAKRAECAKQVEEAKKLNAQMSRKDIKKMMNKCMRPEREMTTTEMMTTEEMTTEEITTESPTLRPIPTTTA